MSAVRFQHDSGEPFYKCSECDIECNEDGTCFEGNEPCYYCPPDTCEGCGRGFCDQSC